MPRPLPASAAVPRFRRASPDPAASPADPARQGPLYEIISDLLRRAIGAGDIPEGSVLLEGPVADILRSTRTPVRQALQALEEQGLVSRFDGRGYVAGPAGVEPRRVALDAAMLGIADGAQGLRKTLGWEAIYERVEHDVVTLSVFDAWRINELELARHFGVGRVVARDVLLRLERLGLVEKDERLRWAVRTLDADRINHLYELRWLLEPSALRSGGPAAPAAELAAMADDLRRALKAYPRVTPGALDGLEHALHVALLSRCANPELLRSLEPTRCVLTLSKHALGESAPMPEDDPFMGEHLAIVEAVQARDMASAEGLLRAHLEASCLKVIQRVELVRTTSAAPRLPYVGTR